MKKRIKAVIFDVGGVLQIPKSSALASKVYLNKVHYYCMHRNLGIHEYLAKKFKISLDQWFDAIDTVYAKSIEGQISNKRVINIISKNLNVNKKIFEKYAVYAYKKNFILNKQLFNQALKLKSREYRIALLSDQWYISKKALVIKEFYKQFNPIVISCDAGMRKPSKKIYLLTLKKLNMHPHEVLFIDNQKWNISPAKKLGMNTILFKDNKQLFKEKNWRNLFKNDS